MARPGIGPISTRHFLTIDRTPISPVGSGIGPTSTRHGSRFPSRTVGSTQIRHGKRFPWSGRRCSGGRFGEAFATFPRFEPWPCSQGEARRLSLGRVPGMEASQRVDPADLASIRRSRCDPLGCVHRSSFRPRTYRKREAPWGSHGGKAWIRCYGSPSARGGEAFRIAYSTACFQFAR